MSFKNDFCCLMDLLIERTKELKNVDPKRLLWVSTPELRAEVVEFMNRLKEDCTQFHAEFVRIFLIDRVEMLLDFEGKYNLGYSKGLDLVQAIKGFAYEGDRMLSLQEQNERAKNHTLFDFSKKRPKAIGDR